MELPQVGQKPGRVQRSDGQPTRYKRIRGLQCYDEVYERLEAKYREMSESSG